MSRIKASLQGFFGEEIILSEQGRLKITICGIDYEKLAVKNSIGQFHVRICIRSWENILTNIE
jgi:hypothetical protein